VGEIIKERQSLGYSQKKLEEVSGVKQPVIARLERGTSQLRVQT
jgi:predicted transcriptional regulator